MNLMPGCWLAITLCLAGCHHSTYPAQTGPILVQLKRQPDGSVTISAQNVSHTPIAIRRHGDRDGFIQVNHLSPDGNWVKPDQMYPGVIVDPMEVLDSDWQVLKAGQEASWQLGYGDDGASTLQSGEEARIKWLPTLQIPKSIGKRVTVFPQERTFKYVTVQ